MTVVALVAQIEAFQALSEKGSEKGGALKENRFGIEPELIAKIARRGHRITEVPIKYNARSHAEGKKIGWKDGVRAIWCIVRYSRWD